MEHGLKANKFYVQKRIAPRAICYVCQRRIYSIGLWFLVGNVGLKYIQAVVCHISDKEGENVIHYLRNYFSRSQKLGDV